MMALVDPGMAGLVLPAFAHPDRPKTAESEVEEPVDIRSTAGQDAQEAEWEMVS